MKDSATLVCFRQDLRLSDNPALAAAAQRGSPIIPVYIHSPGEEAPWEAGAASLWWLHHALTALDTELRGLGLSLVVRRGPVLEALRLLASETGGTAVFWNRRYEPRVIERDTAVREALQKEGIEVRSFNAALLREPWTIKNKSGGSYQVFTPFWRHWLELSEPEAPIPRPTHLVAPKVWPKSLGIEELQLMPKSDWASGMRRAWQPGESGASRVLTRFLDDAFVDYSERRDVLSAPGTSRLSPHLHFGEISPRQVWHGVRELVGRVGPRPKRLQPSHRVETGGDQEKSPMVPRSEAGWRDSQFMRELGWREFAHHVLFHHPRSPEEPLRAEYAEFPWRHDTSLIEAWRQGRTGYPVVDAGMRELWETGWMHNRARMISASFLVKDLLHSWLEGARWFWDTLVDADLANNTLGWQWTAGCGADAAPFFRVFNPTLQGAKFDPEGDYVRRWCPELAKLPSRWIHEPSKAPAAVLRTAAVSIGHSYPEPVVSHAIAREVALEAFRRIKP